MSGGSCEQGLRSTLLDSVLRRLVCVNVERLLPSNTGLFPTGVMSHGLLQLIRVPPFTDSTESRKSSRALGDQ